MDVKWLAGSGRTLTRFGETPRYREGLHRVSERCYAWMVPNGSWGETNLGLVDCGGRSVLVDTAWDVPFTREFLEAARDLVGRAPVECVVNTHSDGDHFWGNQLFSGRRIIGTRAAVERMEHVLPKTVRALVGSSRLMRRIPVGGVAELGRYVEGMFRPYDFDGIRLTKPTETFSGERAIRVGDVELVLRELGPGHTDGDAIVHVPSEKVVYAGDLLFVGVTPVMWAGPIENMVAGLRVLLSLPAEVFVSGHGPLASRADIQALVDYWDFVHEGILRRFRSGLSPTEAARDVLVSAPFRDSPFARWDSSERLVTSAHTMYRNWGRRTSLPETLATMDLLRRQAVVASELSRGR
ncbi:MAG TPA: MBL fold metallo-hydrolase [Polyangiaceae bacterium]|nr:MBL fold metallo-hydrolase [Polyangiaceae bacterium]